MLRGSYQAKRKNKGGGALFTLLSGYPRECSYLIPERSKKASRYLTAKVGNLQDYEIRVTGGVARLSFPRESQIQGNVVKKISHAGDIQWSCGNDRHKRLTKKPTRVHQKNHILERLCPERSEIPRIHKSNVNGIKEAALRGLCTSFQMF